MPVRRLSRWQLRQCQRKVAMANILDYIPEGVTAFTKYIGSQKCR